MTSCQICQREIGDKDKEFSEDDYAHPGVLGNIDKACYSRLQNVDEGGDPALPWTDPISGEVDFEGMEQDLGVSTGAEDFENGEEDGYY